MCFQLFHSTKVGNLNPADYESRQVFYTSKDGTEVPMFIINRKVNSELCFCHGNCVYF